MQTFLPYPDFAASARVLDYRRLGKQRVETFQLLNAIRGVDKNGLPKVHKGWVNHPATVMWRQYPLALAVYGAAMCAEWKSRGYNDTLEPKFLAYLASTDESEIEMPYWLGDTEFHRSHQSNLLRKDRYYYSLHFVAPDDLPYVWFPEFQEKSLIST